MKEKLLHVFVVCLVALFAGSISANAEDAQLLSFGFYQEDNAGVLTKDYVAVVPELVSGKTTYEFGIAMPASIDRSSLVARFTVNSGNVVTVYGTSQTSGVTSNDFEDPVDYLVRNSNGTNNIRYTITVTEEKADSKVWTKMASLNPTAITGNSAVTGAYAGAVLKLNPKTGEPYVAFGVRGADNKLTVAKFVGSQWAKVGAASFTNIIAGSNYSMDIALDGTPYILYSDKGSANQKSPSVMKYNGSAWELVGTQGYETLSPAYMGIAALENTIVTAMQNSAVAGSYAKRAAITSIWNGTAWQTESPISGTYGAAATASNGKVAYALFVPASAPYAYTIIKAASATDKSVVLNAKLPEGAVSGYLYENSMAIAPDGTLYLLANDKPDGGVYKVRMSKVVDGALTTVGGDVPPIPYTSSGYDRHMIVRAAIAPDGTPYIAYNNYTGDKGIYYLYLDSETKQWVDPIKIADAEGGSASDVNIAFTSTGIGYITYTDANNVINLFRYDTKENNEALSVKSQMTDYPVKKELFDISGKRISKVGKGIVIQRMIGANGKVVTKKIVR